MVMCLPIALFALFPGKREHAEYVSGVIHSTMQNCFGFKFDRKQIILTTQTSLTRLQCILFKKIIICWAYR